VSFCRGKSAPAFPGVPSCSSCSLEASVAIAGKWCQRPLTPPQCLRGDHWGHLSIPVDVHSQAHRQTRTAAPWRRAPNSAEQTVVYADSRGTPPANMNRLLYGRGLSREFAELSGRQQALYL
jgi:hypothetical protein